MDSGKAGAAPEPAAGLVERFRSRGVRLWAQHGRVHFDAPTGVLAPGDVQILRHNREHILQFLEYSEGGTPSPRQVPVTHTQLQHWNLYRLGQRKAIRQIAAARRLSGSINLQYLDRAVEILVDRHEALRTRIQWRSGVPVQWIVESGKGGLQRVDLTGLQKSEYTGACFQWIERTILEPLDVSREPLLCVRCLEFSEGEHVLIVALEHLVADVISLEIIFRDLLGLYTQIERGGEETLAPVRCQFSQFAREQSGGHPAWLAQHSVYWGRRLLGCRPQLFPNDISRADSRSGWGTEGVHIEPALKRQLRTQCKLQQTTLPLWVLTAYVGLVSRWCSVTDVVIRYRSDGRARAEIADTVGYFASMLYLRVQTYPGDSFPELLSRVTDEYCNAYSHMDSGFLEAAQPRPAFSRNPAFNWIPAGPSLRGERVISPTSDLVQTPIPFVHPMQKTVESDDDPVLVLFESALAIDGEIVYSRNRHSAESMQRFAYTFRGWVESWAKCPHLRLGELSGPA